MRVVTIGILGFLTATASAPATTWDAVAEFSGVASTARFWSYNYSLDGVTNGLVPLPAYDFFDGDSTAKFSNGSETFRWKVWRDPATNSNIYNAYMTIGANKTTSNWVPLVSKFVPIPAKTIFMHPPVKGSVVLTFTAPRAVSGTVDYNFAHLSCSGAGIEFEVQQIRPAPYRPFFATIDHGSLTSCTGGAFATTGSKSVQIALLKGDQIDFIVRPLDPTGNQYDSTGLTASITE